MNKEKFREAIELLLETGGPVEFGPQSWGQKQFPLQIAGKDFPCNGRVADIICEVADVLAGEA